MAVASPESVPIHFKQHKICFSSYLNPVTIKQGLSLVICDKRVINSINGGDRDLALTFHLKYWRSWGSNKHPLGINLLTVATPVYRLGYYVELIIPELLKGHIQC